MNGTCDPPGESGMRFRPARASTTWWRRCRLILPALLAFAVLHGQRPQSIEDAYGQNNIGVAYLERFEFDRAAEAFRQSLSADPTLDMARLNLAIALLYAGDLTGSEREAGQATARTPSSPQAHYVAGLTARAANRPEAAASAFQRVLELDPDDVGSRVLLGQIRLADRQYTEAAALFQAAISREPMNATAAYGLATALLRAGRRPEGEAAMARFQALRDNPAAITYSANYLEQGRYGEAVSSTGLEEPLVDRSPAAAASFEDATSAMLGEDQTRGSATLFDMDGDGYLDLVVATSTGVHLSSNTRGRFSGARDVDTAVRAATAVIAGDYDNDGKPDLFALTRGGGALLRQQVGGAFSRTPLPPALQTPEGAAPARTAAFADVDHDGDLDIVMAPPARLLRNNGNGSFTDITSAAGLSGAPSAIAIVPTDFDNHRDIDLLLAGAGLSLFSNMRDGTFRDAAAQVGLPAGPAITAVAAGDVNKDGFSDFFFASFSGDGMFAMSSGRGTFVVSRGAAGAASATAVQFVDTDRDGLLDLVALTPAGARLWRNLGNAWSDVSAQAFPGSLRPAGGDAPVTMSAGDLGSRRRRGSGRHAGVRAPARLAEQCVRCAQLAARRARAAGKQPERHRCQGRNALRQPAEPRRDFFSLSAGGPCRHPVRAGHPGSRRRRPRALALGHPPGRDRPRARRGHACALHIRGRRGGSRRARSEAVLVPVSLHLERLKIRVRDRLHGRR